MAWCFALSQVYILDSTGISILLELHQACEAAGGKKLMLAGADSFVRDALEELDLKKNLPVVSSVTEAIRLVSG